MTLTRMIALLRTLASTTVFPVAASVSRGLRRGRAGRDAGAAVAALGAVVVGVAVFVGVVGVAPVPALSSGIEEPTPRRVEDPALTLDGPAEPMAPRFLDHAPAPDAAPPGDPAARAFETFLYDNLTSDSPYRRLSLHECVALAIGGNLDLVNARRDIEISRSRLRESEAFFIPFVELIGSATYSETRRDQVNPFTQETHRHRQTLNRQDGRVEVTQNLASGGRLLVGGGSNRTRGAAGFGPDGGAVAYESEVGARFVQPLLRGGGFDVGTADLRQSRLGQIAQEIGYRLRERDVVLAVIQQYFLTLQASQDLLVSRDALAEKSRFLEETRIRYDRGRVAETAILRAELQHLQEQETAIRRRQTFEDRRERLAVLLGLPPETPLSLQNVVGALAERGRYQIPDVEEALAVGQGSRLEMLLSDVAYEQSRVSLQVARNNVLPNLDLTTGGRLNDRDETLGGSADLDDNHWDAGLELRIPLPNLARREQRRRAEITVEKARTDIESREQRIAEEILAAHRAVRSAESGLAILDKTVEQAEKNLELINGSFEVGYSTITEVRLAQDDLFAAQTRYNNTLLNYQIAIARFYVALGQDLY